MSKIVCNERSLCNKEDCKQCFEKSFASSDKAKYWSDKNELKPKDVFKSTHNKYWFDCVCGHQFNSALSSINNNSWCPYCSNQKLCNLDDCKQCYEKSFVSSNKAKYWSNKNELKPRYVFKSTNKKYWFDCICGHKFDKQLNDINKDGWCPYCANKKLCNLNQCKQCFENSFESCDKAKYWSDKNELKPRDVFKNSHNKYWFDCKCGHTFESSLRSINNSWCPYCSNPPLKICDSNECKQCYEKSFASNNFSKYWSDKNELKPRYVFKSANKKYWFDCTCGHTFDCSLGNINNDRRCPYCANPPKQLCDLEDCKQCYKKSFASSDKAKYWSNKNKLKPRYIFKFANKKYWFDCICGHTFDCSLGNITSNGNWCCYCANKALCDNIDCNKCFEKSFASSDKAKYWSNKNKLNPRQIFKNSHIKYIFICDENHIFNMNTANITNGCWCPYCVNKTEQKLHEQLIKLYPTLQQQYKVEWCKKKTYLPFDFVIPEYNIIIELDGPQHFIQISNWSSPKEQQINDKFKIDCANKNNYSVIRLTQEDVFYDTYDWLDELNQNIQKIINEKVIQNIYMCKNNEYDVFKNQ